MVMGFNTEVEHDGMVFHVQTEPRKDAKIETVVYLNGAIIHSLKTSYQTLLKVRGFNDHKLSRLVKAQHRRVVVRIRSGEIKPPGTPAEGAELAGLMTIQLNGEPREVPGGLTLGALLDWLKLPRDSIAVERNLEIVQRNSWDLTPVERGDRLEVVHFVGGGAPFAARPRGGTYSSPNKGHRLS
jgi:sulfur carrier protein